ncbi:MAG TPA: carboxypeptidase-like regulatory domain-containing protein [Bryobacteraceae bacterium]|nr:carboxypeptidase-like regulatory domain-containing protein [Bryobacteraceae bacterium]
MKRLQFSTALALALAAHAQTSRGTVTGTVLDQSGAAISGAQASLVGMQTGIKLSTTSNDAGVYRFDAVDLSTYELQVTHPGFRNYVGNRCRSESCHHCRPAAGDWRRRDSH